MIERVRPIAEAIHARGGKALAVGGYVRDQLLGRPCKDLDVEVYGLSAAALEEVLGGFGEVMAFGRAFGVVQIKGYDVDFSLPRRDSKVSSGHRGFEIEVDPELDFGEAARRRDLTINAMGMDLLSHEILDPHGGRADLEARVLRATDPRHFAEDPLRGLRVMQFAARFEMAVDAELCRLCRELDLSELPGDRLRGEFDKWLLQAARPSLGLEVLRSTEMLRFFPELAALVDVPQDPTWHPEGDVWIHTAMTLDAAAELRQAGEGADALMYASLCHDFGKPLCTEVVEGRVRALAHDAAGIEPSRRFLARLRIPNELSARVLCLVEHHLAPSLLFGNGAGPRAYRRLARRLAAVGVTPQLLERVARADSWGRTTEEARARRYEAGDHFLAQFESLEIPPEGPQDAVLGRHLLARGIEPGPQMGELLRRCRELQDETGWTDPDRILDVVLTADR